MFERKLGQRVRVVIEGEVTWLSAASSAMSIRSNNDFTHQVYVDHVETIELLKPDLDQYGPSSILWVKIKDKPGTVQVVKLVSSIPSGAVYMSIVGRNAYDVDEIEDVTGVEYHAPVVKASAVNW